MARRGYGGSRRGGYRGRGRKSAPKPPGQIKSNKVVQYSIASEAAMSGALAPRTIRVVERRNIAKVARCRGETGQSLGLGR